MPHISAEEWHQLFEAPMQRLSHEEEPIFDFWPYVETIPLGDFDGYDCSAGEIEYVYRHPAGRVEHVLISSNDRAVFMVIVLDRLTKSVVGHRLLDLPRIYDVSDGGSTGSKG